MTDADDPLRIATFEADVTPPVGDPVTYGTVAAVDDPLSCRGVVLLPGNGPVVLAAVDWIGNANGGHDAWRFALADAAGTAPERVAVHAVHQHEAPMFDADAEALLAAHGIEGEGIDAAFAREALRRSARALREAAADPEAVTHAGVGTAPVDRVASNRQLLGADGTCVHFRASSEPDAEWRDAPEGLIDPKLRMLSFWNGEEPLAALSYYATHPQSYYRNGRVTCDFPGIARDRHEESAGVFRIHFTGAAGNVAAGKYNDGSEERRPVLARRMADAWATTDRTPVTAGDVGWTIERVALPPAERFERADLPMERSALVDALASDPDRDAARCLAWLRRCETGHRIDLPCLRVGDVRVLHLPGEPFVEYGIAAARWRPDLTVATAGYGDYGPGYVGTRAAYPRGGYEVSIRPTSPPRNRGSIAEGVDEREAPDERNRWTATIIPIAAVEFGSPRPVGSRRGLRDRSAVGGRRSGIETAGPCRRVRPNGFGGRNRVTERCRTGAGGIHGALWRHVARSCRTSREGCPRPASRFRLPNL